MDVGSSGAAGGARSIAVIMDGNGRWAERRGLPVAEGHRAGTRALRRTVEAAINTITTTAMPSWRISDESMVVSRAR